MDTLTMTRKEILATLDRLETAVIRCGALADIVIHSGYQADLQKKLAQDIVEITCAALGAPTCTHNVFKRREARPA